MATLPKVLVLFENLGKPFNIPLPLKNQSDWGFYMWSSRYSSMLLLRTWQWDLFSPPYDIKALCLKPHELDMSIFIVCLVF